MDEPITATNVNRSFSALIRGVQNGRSYVVTAHGRPVARIVPIDERTDDATVPSIAEKFDANSEKAKQARKKLFERLEKTEAIDIGPWTRAELYDDLDEAAK